MNKNNEGTITIATLFAITVVSVSVGIAFHVTSSTARVTDRSQDMAVVQAASEGAIEQAYGVWKARLAQMYSAIPQTAMADLSAPTFNGTTGGIVAVSPTDAYGAPTATASPTLVSVPDYPGWKGRRYTYIANAKYNASSTLGDEPLSYGVKRTFSYTLVPLFQAMFFFEHDLELYKPAVPMLVSGLVHSNSDLYLSTGTSTNGALTFQGYVSYVVDHFSATGGAANSPGNTAPPFAAAWSGTGSMYPATYPNGASNQVHQVDRLEPLGNDPATVLDPLPPLATNPDLYSSSGLFIGVDGDTDGNPNNDSFRELIEPPDISVDDPPEIANRRIFTKAGIVVTVNGSSKTVTTKNGTSLDAAAITKIQNAISTTTIYDRREQKDVRVQNVDMSAIFTTTSGVTSLVGASGFNGVLYIQDETATTASIPKNAIRLQKGGKLPDGGLTVASPNGVYIQGDYNTGTTTSSTSVPANYNGNPNNTDEPTVSGYTRKPAAVIGDAIMILSNSWTDSNSDDGLSSRVASNTTINTALLGGFIPGGYKPDPDTEYGYSGGANNYPRFLENWSGKYMTYFGSMVELFQSKNFTGRWNTGSIYSPPSRCWNYDTNFDTTPPPGAIDAVATTRGTWTRYE
jgi:hypothetical protein